MLSLDTDKRITAEQTLAHPYLAQYADPSDEPSSSAYDQTFEDYDIPVQEWKGNQTCLANIWNELINFSPVLGPSDQHMEWQWNEEPRRRRKRPHSGSLEEDPNIQFHKKKITVWRSIHTHSFLMHLYPKFVDFSCFSISLHRTVWIMNNSLHVIKERNCKNIFIKKVRALVRFLGGCRPNLEIFVKIGYCSVFFIMK